MGEEPIAAAADPLSAAWLTELQQQKLQQQQAGAAATAATEGAGLPAVSGLAAMTLPVPFAAGMAAGAPLSPLGAIPLFAGDGGAGAGQAPSPLPLASSPLQPTGSPPPILDLAFLDAVFKENDQERTE
jgi:hypothetical protein